MRRTTIAPDLVGFVEAWAAVERHETDGGCEAFARRQLRALLAVARAAREDLRATFGELDWEWMERNCTDATTRLARALRRLDSVSGRGAARRRSGGRR